jgi:hypothetical protein
MNFRAVNKYNFGNYRVWVRQKILFWGEQMENIFSTVKQSHIRLDSSRLAEHEYENQELENIIGKKVAKQFVVESNFW